MPVASSVRARASRATRSGWPLDVSSSGVAIDPVAPRRDIGPAKDGQHQGSSRRGDMERITVVADHAEAELAEQGNLVHGDLGEIDDHCRLGDAALSLADDLRVTGAAQENDALGDRLIRDDRKAFS